MPLTHWRRRRDMREAYLSGATPSERGHAPVHPAAEWLCLAAAPTFATMALLSGAFSVGPPDMICSATQHTSPLNGMVVMYLLMSAFHSAPWLKLIFSRQTMRAGPDLSGAK
jgi:hypothetical protein